MKKLFLLLAFLFLFGACALPGTVVQNGTAQPPIIWTSGPTQLPYPTQTPQLPIIVTREIVVTATNDLSNTNCTPITGMDYSDNSKIALELQSYVSKLPGVKSMSYVVPERLYTNSLSELFHIEYVSSDDGQVYSKRYIVYITEFGWKNAVFSIDGQCWIDPPH